MKIDWSPISGPRIRGNEVLEAVTDAIFRVHVQLRPYHDEEGLPARWLGQYITAAVLESLAQWAPSEAEVPMVREHLEQGALDHLLPTISPETLRQHPLEDAEWKLH